MTSVCVISIRPYPPPEPIKGTDTSHIEQTSVIMWPQVHTYPYGYKKSNWFQRMWGRWKEQKHRALNGRPMRKKMVCIETGGRKYTLYCSEAMVREVEVEMLSNLGEWQRWCVKIVHFAKLETCLSTSTEIWPPLEGRECGKGWREKQGERISRLKLIVSKSWNKVYI